MAQFYGYSIEYLLNLENRNFMMLADAMHSIKAREYLVLMNVADFPNQNNERREKMHSEFFKIAYPIKKSSKILSNAELMKKLTKG